MDLEIWIPTLVATGAMAFIWFDIRSFKKTMLTEMLNFKQDMMTKKKRLEDEFLTVEKHDMLCENRGLKVSERISLLELSVKDGFKHISELIMQQGQSKKA